MRGWWCVAFASLVAIAGASVPVSGVPQGAQATAAAGLYTPVPPARLYDSRQSRLPILEDQTRTLPLAGLGNVPASGVSAVVINVTATQGTKGGYFTIWSAGRPQPATSSVNFTSNSTVANLVTVPLGTGGAINIYNAYGSTHVLVDIVGYYSAGGSTAAGAPSGFLQQVDNRRLLDTRSPLRYPLRAGEWKGMTLSYGDPSTTT